MTLTTQAWTRSLWNKAFPYIPTQLPTLAIQINKFKSINNTHRDADDPGLVSLQAVQHALGAEVPDAASVCVQVAYCKCLAILNASMCLVNL